MPLLNLGRLIGNRWVAILILLCVLPSFPLSLRCNYYAFAAAEEKNVTLYAVTVRQIEGSEKIKQLLESQEAEAPPCEAPPEEPPPEDVPFEAKDSQGNDLPAPVPLGETIDTTACLSPKAPESEEAPPEEPPEVEIVGVPEMEPCPLGAPVEEVRPCDTVNEAYNAVTTVEGEGDAECVPSPEEQSMVMAECRSCTARLNPNGGGVKLTCYDCQHQLGDRTCLVSKVDAIFRVSTKFFEVAGFGLTNATGGE